MIYDQYCKYWNDIWPILQMQKQELCCQSCFNAMQKSYHHFFYYYWAMQSIDPLRSRANTVHSDQTAHWRSNLGLQCVQTVFKTSLSRHNTDSPNLKIEGRDRYRNNQNIWILMKTTVLQMSRKTRLKGLQREKNSMLCLETEIHPLKHCHNKPQGGLYSEYTQHNLHKPLWQLGFLQTDLEYS